MIAIKYKQITIYSIIFHKKQDCKRLYLRLNFILIKP